MGGKMKGRKPQSLDNRKVQIVFTNCDRLSTATKEYAFIGDIFRGASCLDLGGNKWPIPVASLFLVIKVLPDITSSAIQKLLRISKSYARKVASVCRVISKECEKEFARRGISTLEGSNPNTGGINLLQAAIDRDEYHAWLACSKYYVRNEMLHEQEPVDEVENLDFAYEIEDLVFA
ncbi:hypothetical protein [Herbaspirillum robiniae]|uniref:hypothetical protein n=1 Tax=Herbaspirillum robiniae TaxID=2014887 RepID=UPI0011E4D657|nr:hypothetical protein [Herbaspirillum robiniae]